MVLFDEQLNVLDQNEVRLAIQGFEDEGLLSDDEMEIELEDYYNTALQVDVSHLSSVKNLSKNLAKAQFIGGGLLRKVRDAVCKIIKATSTRDEIIDAILDAISSIIPGGIFIAKIAKKLIKYLLNLGFDAICPQ